MKNEEQLQELKRLYGNHSDFLFCTRLWSVPDKYTAHVKFNFFDYYINKNNILDYYERIRKSENNFFEENVRISIQPLSKRNVQGIGKCPGIDSLWIRFRVYREKDLNEACAVLYDQPFSKKCPPSYLIQCSNNELFAFWRPKEIWKRNKNNAGLMDILLSKFKDKILEWKWKWNILLEPISNDNLDKYVSMPGTLHKTGDSAVYMTHLCYFDVDDEEIVPLDIDGDIYFNQDWPQINQYSIGTLFNAAGVGFDDIPKLLL